mmetsp:Transcript_67400/g.147701  ORF Transcript_67400/g.147701 Transcript_67400/m.147701 type:complete len:254 (+) Transcript_67400:1751-2512(+)
MSLKIFRLMTNKVVSSLALKVASRRMLYNKESSPKLSPVCNVLNTFSIGSGASMEQARPRFAKPWSDVAAQIDLSSLLVVLRKAAGIFLEDSSSSSRRGSLVKTEQLRLSLFFLLSTTGMCNFIRKSCFLLMRSAMENAAAAAAADVPDFCAVIFSVVMTTSMLPVSMTKNSSPRSPNLAAALPAFTLRISESDTISFIASWLSSLRPSTKARKLGLFFMERMMKFCCSSFNMGPGRNPEGNFFGDSGVVAES